MPPSEPSWWYGAPDDVRARLLAPLSRAYGALVQRRFEGTTPYRSRLPIVCVGNFTAGGAGKTPFSLMLAGHLAAKGRRIAFLSRGYGGTLKGPHWVEPSVDTAHEVGDEPLLLARAAPTLVCRNRRQGMLAIEQSPRPIDVVVMDDGLQNPSLAKDLVIAVVDGMRGLGNGEVMPAGPLRAPYDFQASLADAIAVNLPELPVEGETPPALVGRLRNTFPGPVLMCAMEPVGDLTWLRETPLVAYAGIGNPQRFFTMLERLGARLAETVTFADHQAFTEAEARRLLERARIHDAHLVTTEKDLVRLDGAIGARAELRGASRAVGVRLTLAPEDATRLDALLAVLAAAAPPRDR